jgi:hypothetical protein
MTDRDQQKGRWTANDATFGGPSWTCGVIEGRITPQRKMNL